MPHPVMTACAVAAAFALAPPVPAANPLSPQVSPPPARVEILKGWRDLSGGKTQHVFGFKIILDDGWKTYWRSPGDEGIPPAVTWTILSNAADPQIDFPAPRLIADAASGVSVIGYRDSVVFPVTVSVADPGAAAFVAGNLEFGVCRDVCVPERVEFRAELAADLDILNSEIVMARGSAPDRIDAAAAGLRFRCRFRPAGNNQFLLTAEIETGLAPAAALAAVPEYPDSRIWFSDLESGLSPNGAVRLSARMAHLGGHLPAIDRSKLNVTIVTAQSATVYSGCRSST